MAESLRDLGIVAIGSRRNVKAACPRCGHSGMRSHPSDKSLSVNVEEGVFKCHYCGFKGRIGTAADGYGAPFRMPKAYAKPVAMPGPWSDRALEFFDHRGISRAALETYGVYEQDGALKFPYLRGGDLVNVKTRYPGKKFAMEADCELVFFGLDQAAGAEQVAIVEGEMDVLACATAGIPAVLSVPNGASSGTGEMAYLESGEPLFEAAHTVVLAVDGDAPGQLLESELARRIGKSKCCRVRWPEGSKDANDVLMRHGAEALRGCFADAEDYPVDGAHWFGDYVEDAILLRKTQRQRGESTGWRSIDELYTVAPGELTVITGVPGSGKSEWLDALMVNLAQFSGWTFAVYSPENAPGEQHFVKLAQKYLGMPYWPGPHLEMSDADIRSFGTWATDRFLWLDPETPTLDAILGIARGFVFRKGIRGLVIDPWNRMDHSRPEGVTITEHVKDVLVRLSAFARRHEVHVWLVAHPKKLAKEDGKIPVPTPYDIADSAHFFNVADNCIAVSRDKGSDEAPVEVTVQKVRFQRVGRLGTACLGYDRVTGRYREVR